MKLVISLLLLCSLYNLTIIVGYKMKYTSASLHKMSSMKLQSSESESKSTESLTVDDLAKKIKVISFGQNEDRYGLQVADRSYTDKLIELKMTAIGGFGFELVEFYTIKGGVGVGGLVLLDQIVTGSNAEKAKFQVGDALCSISEGNNPPTLLEGLNYDETLNRLLRYKDKSEINVTVKRMMKRKEIVVEMVGPQGEDAGSFVVFSGYGSNMRLALNSKNMRIYDDRTARFDSPYQTGNCGGEGTCGTCVVQVLEGSNLLNPRKDVEDKALKKLGAPNNYRWSCRIAIGPEQSKGGKVKIKLRPQSQSW